MTRSSWLALRLDRRITYHVIASGFIFLCACGSDKPINRLTMLTINPKTASVALGEAAQFTAIATYDDGTKKDVSNAVSWRSSQPKLGNITPAGLVIPGSTGQLTISAVMGSTTAAATLNVSDAAIVSLQIRAPSTVVALGNSEQLTAIAGYTNGGTRDVTAAVSWSSGAASVAAVNQAGLVATKACGAAVVAASIGTARASFTLTVSPANLLTLSVRSSATAIPVGTTAQLSATGTFSDGTSQDLTNSVTWQSATPQIVSVVGTGVAKGIAVGNSLISATTGAITASTQMTVAAATLESITVTSPLQLVPVGSTTQLTAVGTFSDGTTQDLSASVQWQSASAQILSVTTAGSAQALAVGSSLISASSGTISGSTLLTVSPAALVGITVSPLNPLVPLGQKQQLIATGSYTDGSTYDLTNYATWTSGNPQVATVNNQGLVVPQQVGTTGVVASFDGMTGSQTVIVQPVLSVNYFSIPEITDSAADTALRITDSATPGRDICAMVYVFDQDQQMSECCGCVVSDSGLLTLSIEKDLTSNPLTGVRSTTGVVKVVSADHVSNPSCNPGSITPSGTVTSWSTHAQLVGKASGTFTETSATASPLGAEELTGLQAQCTFVMLMGSGQGICTCGTGEAPARHTR